MRGKCHIAPCELAGIVAHILRELPIEIRLDEARPGQRYFRLPVYTPVPASMMQNQFPESLVGETRDFYEETVIVFGKPFVVWRET